MAEPNNTAATRRRVGVVVVGLGEGIVARVKVLAVLQLFIEELRRRGHAAVELEQTLFLGSAWRGHD